MPLPNYDSILQQSQQASTQAIQPALKQLESTKPNLKTQYDTLIGQLTQREGQDITQANQNTSQSLEERGILGGAYAPQQVAKNQQPIKQYYTGQNQQAFNTYNTGLQDVASRIAQLQSGAQQNALQLAQGRYGQEYGAYNDEITRQTQLQEAERQRQFQAQQDALTRAASVSAARASASPTINTATPKTQAAPGIDANQLGIATRSLSKQGNQDKYIDIKEAQSAARQLQQITGVDNSTASAIIEAAIKSAGLSKWRW